MIRLVPSKTLLPDAMQTWEEHSTDGKPENKDRKNFFLCYLCREMITKFNLQDSCYLLEISQSIVWHITQDIWAQHIRTFLWGIKRESIDTGKKISFYFKQFFENVSIFAHISANTVWPPKFFFQVIQYEYQINDFYADLKFVEVVSVTDPVFQGSNLSNRYEDDR